MKTLKTVLILLFSTWLPWHLHAQDDEKKLWRAECGMAVSMFQQQVKAEIGDPSGQKLHDEYHVGFLGTVHRSIIGSLSGGVFFMYDFGSRQMAQFAGFDSLGKTVTVNNLGGLYREFWLGPVLRYEWRKISFDAGYAIIGTRTDDSRIDIQSATGAVTGSFTINPKVAWFFALGASVLLTKNLDFNIKVEYRGRYYNQRDGNSLKDDIDFGTQSLSPYSGLSFRF